MLGLLFSGKTHLSGRCMMRNYDADVRMTWFYQAHLKPLPDSGCPITDETLVEFQQFGQPYDTQLITLNPLLLLR